MDPEVTCIDRDEFLNFKFNENGDYFYSGRIDYCFSFDSICLNEINFNLISIECNRVKVLSELFELSDHFPTEIEFKFL